MFAVTRFGGGGAGGGAGATDGSDVNALLKAVQSRKQAAAVSKDKSKKKKKKKEKKEKKEKVKQQQEQTVQTTADDNEQHQQPLPVARRKRSRSGASDGSAASSVASQSAFDPEMKWAHSRTFRGFAGSMLNQVGSRKRPRRHTATTSEDTTAATADSATPAAASAAATATAPSAIDDGQAWGLDASLLKVIKAQGVTTFFPIQRSVVPAIVQAEAHNSVGFGDVCIAAPTGSGKTLTYVLPVVQALLHRTVRRLRALVLVPTRDLVLQVLKVFRMYCQHTTLRVEAAMGQVPFHEESKLLQGGDLDILVSTPGRLIDHLDDTPGFSLQFLRFLVVDEADRLLTQSYQNWIHRVYESAFPSVPMATPAAPGIVRSREGRGRDFSAACQPATATATATIRAPLRKILASATLTTNPQKLALLALNHPITFKASDVATEGLEASTKSLTDDEDKRFKTPEGLREGMIVCHAEKKPLVLVHLLQQLGPEKQALVFANSVESTHRLARLLQLFGGLAGKVVEFSANLPQSRRSKVLKKIRKHEVQIVVSSDAGARGLDLPGLDAVVQYDAPPHIRTYIHRVGRTARAGKEGVTYTLLEPQQVRHFRDQLRRANNSYVRKETVPAAVVRSMAGRYQRVLKALRKVLRHESGGKLGVTDPVAVVKHVEGEVVDSTTVSAIGVASSSGVRALKAAAHKAEVADAR